MTVQIDVTETNTERYIEISGIKGRTGEMRIVGPQSANIGQRQSAGETTAIRVNLPEMPGHYRLKVGGVVTDRITLHIADVRAGTKNIGRGWNGTIKRVNWMRTPENSPQNLYDTYSDRLLSDLLGEGYDGPTETVQEETEPWEDKIDPSEYVGIVNAGNEEGVALAPALRREGASLGPEGATVNLPDGETVDVGAISEADEVARYVEGDRAGEVVDADRGAVDGGSTDGAGGVVGAVILVAAAAIAILGGYN